MAKVTFHERFDYRPTPSVWITYQPGTRDDVPRQAADQAVAEGKAVEVKATRRRKLAE
jgi:hypothetical protein